MWENTGRSVYSAETAAGMQTDVFVNLFAADAQAPFERLRLTVNFRAILGVCSGCVPGQFVKVRHVGRSLVGVVRPLNPRNYHTASGERRVGSRGGAAGPRTRQLCGRRAANFAARVLGRGVSRDGRVAGRRGRGVRSGPRQPARKLGEASPTRAPREFTRVARATTSPRSICEPPVCFVRCGPTGEFYARRSPDGLSEEDL